MAMLMFEILQTITFSLQALGQQAFLVVSLCLLGLGAGGSLASWISSRDADALLWRAAIVSAASLPLGMLGTSRSFALPALILWGVLPYVPIGVFLALLFRLRSERTSRSYALNLGGSALGCLGLVVVLDGTGDAAVTSLVIAGLALLAALLLAFSAGRGAVLATAAAGLALVPLFAASDALFTWAPAPQRGMAILQNDPEIETTVRWSRWGYLGRLDIVEPGAGIERFPVGGAHAAQLLREGADVAYLFANGGNWTESIDFRDTAALRERVGRTANRSAPYHVLDRPDVLNIGVGAGVDVFTALFWDARSVTGVEINPLMIEAGRDHLASHYDGFHHDERVRILEMDGRTFVHNTDERFDVVTLTWVDTGAALHGNAQVLSESYLYTREAFDDYLHVLRDDGVVYIEHPVANTARNLVTAVEALRARGAVAPEAHIAVIGPGVLGVPGLLVSKSPLRGEQIRSLMAAFSGRLAWVPGRERAGPGLLPGLLRAVAEGRDAEFLAAQEQDYRPVRDDRPFYYQYSRAVFGSPASQSLLRILALVSGVAFVLLLLPLGRLRERDEGGLSLAAVLGYFAAIGFGFMIVEICLIQKLTLVLEHPAYSVTVTLFSVLVFSGLGSMVSGRLPAHSRRSCWIIFAPLLGMALFYAVGLGPLVRSLQIDSLPVRFAVVSALLAPGSFFMGMPFPTMIRHLADAHESLISWAWAINSFASVAGSVLAVFCAMQIGFSLTLSVGAACYLAAPFLFLATLSRRPAPA